MCFILWCSLGLASWWQPGWGAPALGPGSLETPGASLHYFYLSPDSVTMAQKTVRTKEGLAPRVVADHFRTGCGVSL